MSITQIILASFALIILSLAFSTFKWGARIVQGVLIIAIIAVVLQNESHIRAALGGLSGIITTSAKESSNVGGNREKSNES